MSLRFRRILYIIFIIAFLVITPLICLYATGYKITSGFTIQKTGIFVFDTKPKGAKIYLNGKIQRLFLKQYFARNKSHITTPAKIKNILPGEYDIKIKLEGYWPWEKKLTIKPGETTFAEDINLFKTNLPLMVKNGVFDQISSSPDKKNLLLISEREVTALNTENDQGKNFIISTTTQPMGLASTTNIAWSPRGHKVIVGHRLFNLADIKNPANLSRMLKTQAENFKWSADRHDKIFYQTGNDLQSYGLTWHTHKILINEQIFSDYLIRNNYLYSVSRPDQSSRLDIRNLDTETIISTIGLPASSYVFLHPRRKYLNLYDQKHQILYLIDPFSPIKPLRETISNISISHWINETLLLYANDFEIWLYDMADWRKALLTRISSHITDIIWHPSNNYIIYATSNSINILELDNREKYNITKLIELDSIKWPVLNAKGDTIYFVAKIGNQEGLYKLIIQ